MKKSVRSSASKVSKKVPTVSSRSKTSTLSRSVKKYGKKSLRAILLSHTFHAGFKILFVAALVSLPMYAVYAYIGKTVANEVVISKSQILDRVRNHMELPEGSPLAVVRVQDADALKKQNPFYEAIKSGDYILMYKTMAIIYDLRNDQIIATRRIP